MSKQAFLTAGTIFSCAFDPDASPSEYTPIPGVLSVGATGDVSEAKDKTALEDTAKKFGTGMFEGPEKSIKGQFRSTDANVKSLKEAAQQRKSLKFRMEWPDGDNGTTTNGTKAEFEVQLLGFQLDDTTNEDWVTYTIPGKQSGKTTWTDSGAA